MTQFCIQFHATELELKELAAKWLASGLYFVAQQFPPYRVRKLKTIEELEAAITDTATEIIAVTAQEPVVAEDMNQIDFHRLNQERMSLTVGRETKEGLHESSLGARESTRRWKQCVKDLKDITYLGVTVIGISPPTQNRDKKHRFTEGARKLCQTGTVMLSGSPNTVLRFE